MECKMEKVSWWAAKEKHLELHAAAEKLDSKIYTIEESSLEEKKKRKEKAVELFQQIKSSRTSIYNQAKNELVFWSRLGELHLINFSSIETWVSSDHSLEIIPTWMHDYHLGEPVENVDVQVPAAETLIQ